jgi:hypothetical protein
MNVATPVSDAAKMSARPSNRISFRRGTDEGTHVVAEETANAAKPTPMAGHECERERLT